ncbi:MAG TPA: hypothetical protein VKA18_08330 [Alphaproteobacteria bacterium]|nr:hypothetical protein [Alphaproteobacteria bacterium]
MDRSLGIPADGLIAAAKRDFPTCELTIPELVALAERRPLTFYTPNNPTFPEVLAHDYSDAAVHIPNSATASALQRE